MTRARIKERCADQPCAHKAPAGTLDKVAMEMNGAAGALFTKKTELDSHKAKRRLTK